MTRSVRLRTDERLMDDLDKITGSRRNANPPSFRQHQLAQIGDQAFHSARLLEDGGHGRLIVDVSSL